MSKKHELHVVINIDTTNVNHGSNGGAGLMGFLAHLLANSVVTSSTDFTPSTGDAPTPDAPTAAADQPTPVQDTPQPQAPAAPKPTADYTWPEVEDQLSFFESAKNLHNDDTDSGDYPEVIEVTDDWFRVSGVFQSKTGKGTRSVTLKVSRAEVADGSVKYDIY